MIKTQLPQFAVAVSAMNTVKACLLSTMHGHCPGTRSFSQRGKVSASVYI